MRVRPSRSYFSLIAVIVVVAILVSLGLFFAFGGPTTAATGSGPSRTSARSTQSATTDTAFTNSESTSSALSSQSQGGPLQISVTMTISDPPEASPGESAYIFDVTITNTASTSHGVSESDFTVISSSGGVYSSTFVQAMRNSLPTVVLGPGQGDSGQIAFQVTASQNPSRLEFKDQPGNVDELVGNLPQPTAWVSEPSLGGITLTGPQSGQLVATLSFSNSTMLYYTGEVIALQVAANGFHNSGEISINNITLASSQKGISLKSTAPPLPVVVPNCCSDVDTPEYVYVHVYIVAPQSSFTGTISLTGTTD